MNSFWKNGKVIGLVSAVAVLGTITVVLVVGIARGWFSGSESKNLSDGANPKEQSQLVSGTNQGEEQGTHLDETLLNTSTSTTQGNNIESTTEVGNKGSSGKSPAGNISPKSIPQVAPLENQVPAGTSTGSNKSALGEEGKEEVTGNAQPGATNSVKQPSGKTVPQKVTTKVPPSGPRSEQKEATPLGTSKPATTASEVITSTEGPSGAVKDPKEEPSKITEEIKEEPVKVTPPPKKTTASTMPLEEFKKFMESLDIKNYINLTPEQVQKMRENLDLVEAADVADPLFYSPRTPLTRIRAEYLIKQWENRSRIIELMNKPGWTKEENDWLYTMVESILSWDIPKKDGSGGFMDASDFLHSVLPISTTKVWDERDALSKQLIDLPEGPDMLKDIEAKHKELFDLVKHLPPKVGEYVHTSTGDFKKDMEQIIHLKSIVAKKDEEKAKYLKVMRAINPAKYNAMTSL